MKHYKDDGFDREKKIHRVVKGSNKSDKYKKRAVDYLYAMDEDEQDYEIDLYEVEEAVDTHHIRR